MSLRLLLVEDKPVDVQTVREAVERHLTEVEVVHVTNRVEALAAIARADVDIAICDINILAEPGTLTTNDEHGFAVMDGLRSTTPGVPIIILSAWANFDNTIQRTAGAPVVRAFGVDELSMVDAVKKDDLPGFELRLERLASGLSRLEAIEVEPMVDDQALVARAVRQFAHTIGANRVLVARAGGLSGADCAIVSFRFESLPPVGAFVKVDSFKWIEDEERRFDQFVVGRLPPGRYPVSVQRQKSGLRGRAASISTLASDGSTSLFEFMRERPSEAAAVIEQLQAATSNWTLQGVDVETTIGDLRRLHLSDQVARDHGIPIDEFSDIEGVTVTVRETIAHGDLHGENILVDPSGHGMFIDFAYTGLAHSALDPTSLELSFLFHPDAKLVSDASFLSGAYLDQSLFAGSNVVPAARACRAWAESVAGERARLAIAYAHVLRLAKHDNVPTLRALTIAREIRSALQGESRP